MGSDRRSRLACIHPSYPSHRLSMLSTHDMSNDVIDVHVWGTNVFLSKVQNFIMCYEVPAHVFRAAQPCPRPDDQENLPSIGHGNFNVEALVVSESPQQLVLPQPTHGLCETVDCRILVPDIACAVCRCTNYRRRNYSLVNPNTAYATLGRYCAITCTSYSERADNFTHQPRVTNDEDTEAALRCEIPIQME